MSNQETTVKSRLSSKHIILPVCLGLVGIGWLFYNEFVSIIDGSVRLSDYVTSKSLLFLFLALCCTLLHDLSGMRRLHLLSDGIIGFWGAFRVRILYEFINAVTPTAMGGATLEMLFIHKEGVKFGDSTAICIISLFFDELFFVLAFPILWLTLSYSDLFLVDGAIQSGLFSVFLIGYILKLVWVIVLFIGIFIKPFAISWLIMQVCRLPFLRKKRFSALRTAVDIKECSRRMRHKSFKFWGQMIVHSFLLAISRFLVVNMLILAFTDASFLSLYDHIIVVARQIITMVIMMIAPTPGGSGFIEVLFNSYLGEFIPKGVVVVLVVFGWRLLTYYYYLIAGSIIAPRWVSKHFPRKAKKTA